MASKAGQMLLAQFHDSSINFHHVEVFDVLVAQALPCCAAIASPNHQHLFKLGSATQSWVDQRLVIVAFLVFSGHPAAVEQQPFPVAAAVDHRDALVWAFFINQYTALKAIANTLVVFIDPATCCCRRAVHGKEA